MEALEPIKGIEIIDLSLYLKEQKVLVIADLHIGYEEALTKQGIMVPKFHFKDLVKLVRTVAFPGSPFKGNRINLGWRSRVGPVPGAQG
jgi:hypothetical protein